MHFCRGFELCMWQISPWFWVQISPTGMDRLSVYQMWFPPHYRFTNASDNLTPYKLRCRFPLNIMRRHLMAKCTCSSTRNLLCEQGPRHLIMQKQVIQNWLGVILRTHPLSIQCMSLIKSTLVLSLHT